MYYPEITLAFLPSLTRNLQHGYAFGVPYSVANTHRLSVLDRCRNSIDYARTCQGDKSGPVAVVAFVRCSEDIVTLEGNVAVYGNLSPRDSVADCFGGVTDTLHDLKHMLTALVDVNVVPEFEFVVIYVCDNLNLEDKNICQRIIKLMLLSNTFRIVNDKPYRTALDTWQTWRYEHQIHVCDIIGLVELKTLLDKCRELRLLMRRDNLVIRVNYGYTDIDLKTLPTAVKECFEFCHKPELLIKLMTA